MYPVRHGHFPPVSISGLPALIIAPDSRHEGITDLNRYLMCWVQESFFFGVIRISLQRRGTSIEGSRTETS